jgi:Type VII secretion system ESX-1, transport TM domain B
VATKKDLVEAYSFSRRRLVTAFVSGAPGGREVEPARPGRTIVGGLALAVLLVAGAAIAGIFSPSVPEDWADSPGLIVSKETGAAYVITEDAVEEADASDDGTGPVLRPVINITSAMLILGADVTPEIVPQSAIDAETIGDDIGILNAPASVPSDDLLIETGWTACTDEQHGIRVDVSDSPAVQDAPGRGFVVESDDAYYVIARGRPEGAEQPRAYRYRLPVNRGERDDILGDLGLEFSASATSVSGDWLALFAPGGDLDLDSFGLDGLGDPVRYAGGDSGVPDQARIGDYLEGEEGAFVLTEDGPAPLDPFALAVYSNLEGAERPKAFESDDLQVGRALEPYLAAHWPDTRLAPVVGEHCARLLPEAGEVPVVELGTDPAEEASAASVEPDTRSVSVDPGRGAYVLSGDWDDTTEGSPYLIDAKGNANALVGLGTADLLGYAGYEAPVVPDSWVELFDEGVSLSQDAALCPPDPVVGRTCD